MINLGKYFINMKNKRVIFIHGNGADSWNFAWSPWLKNELESLGIEVVFETFPDKKLARAKYWLPHLKDNLKADENTILVGWSSGAVASMRFAEENKIFASLLVAPCYNDLGLESERISGYYDKEWNWDNIHKNQKHIAMFYSKNDEFIPLEDFEFMKEHLNPDYVFISEDKGHFIKEKQFPEILEYIKKIINK